MRPCSLSCAVVGTEEAPVSGPGAQRSTTLPLGPWLYVGGAGQWSRAAGLTALNPSRFPRREALHSFPFTIILRWSNFPCIFLLNPFPLWVTQEQGLGSVFSFISGNTCLQPLLQYILVTECLESRLKVPSICVLPLDVVLFCDEIL